ncbi:MAG: hypothetical protein AAGM67_00230 [Bacteroidota bacterium]
MKEEFVEMEPSTIIGALLALGFVLVVCILFHFLKLHSYGKREKKALAAFAEIDNAAYRGKEKAENIDVQLTSFWYKGQLIGLRYRALQGYEITLDWEVVAVHGNWRGAIRGFKDYCQKVVCPDENERKALRSLIDD